tara:strand:- start:537 stop:782 length:246 start_codon:yes stop_codon:yes gene_type:complete
MRNKLIIASFMLSGIVNAQCDKKCGYNKDKKGIITHIKTCNEYKKLEQDKLFDSIYSKPNKSITLLIKSKRVNTKVLQMVE